VQQQQEQHATARSLRAGSLEISEAGKLIKIGQRVRLLFCSSSFEQNNLTAPPEH
jgi:hypothetical protein